jgi:hypothetical protein
LVYEGKRLGGGAKELCCLDANHSHYVTVDTGRQDFGQEVLPRTPRRGWLIRRPGQRLDLAPPPLNRARPALTPLRPSGRDPRGPGDVRLVLRLPDAARPRVFSSTIQPPRSLLKMRPSVQARPRGGVVPSSLGDCMGCMVVLKMPSSL